MRSVALFAGGGLASVGLHRSGYQDVWANEYDKHIARCYQLNFPKAQVCIKDIGLVNSVHDIPEQAKDCDMLFAGVECDATSISGKKRHDNPKLEHGYHVQTYVIDASYHGSVQQRKRTFIIATKKQFELELQLQDQRALIEACPGIRAVLVGQSKRYWRASNQPALTLTESGGAPKVVDVDGTERKMKVLEGEAIMGLKTNEYQWPAVADSLKWRVLGNGVAVELVEQIAEQLRQHIINNP